MLPILPTSSSDIYRLFLKAEAEWARPLAEEFPLDAGTAFINRKLPDTWDANHLRDGCIPTGSSAAQVVGDVDRFFAEHNSRCAYYVTQDQTLIDHLLASGYRADAFEIHLLRDHRPEPAQVPPDLKIIPARASYRHAREILGDVRVLHLDDPHFECLLALRESKAIACAGLLTIGEIGYITEVHVTADHRRQGTGRLMLNHLLDLCSRAQLRHILLDVRSDNHPAKSLYHDLGFRKVCDHTVYRAPWTAEPR